MTVSKEELLDKLNADLAWEYAAMIQYVQHASVITGAEYESIIAELLRLQAIARTPFEDFQIVCSAPRLRPQ